MKDRITDEWVGFVCGLFFAVIIWSSVHGHISRVERSVLGQNDSQSIPGQNESPTGNVESLGSGRGTSSLGLDKDNGNAGKNKNLVTPAAVTETARGDWTDSVGPAQQEHSSHPANVADRVPAGETARGDWTDPVSPAQREVPFVPANSATAANPAAQNATNRAPAHANETAPSTQPAISVRVYITAQHRVEKVPLETYVRGVVAAEMPAGFEPAALEAQALAARTYIVRRLLLRDDSGMPVANADVTDTQTHQVYRSLSDMDALRITNETAWRKTNNAVNRTKGQIIVYQGQPIQALYFSTSNGYTENSEEVFPSILPYLRSVDSPWDRDDAPRSRQTIELPIRQFYAKLGIRAIPVGARLGGYPKIKVTERTQGERVKTLSVGGKSFTGEEIRSLLDLPSAAFNWRLKADRIIITVYGSGHGVGMSQWGAQGMAQAGNTARQIVEHYYTGTEIMELSRLSL